MTEEIFGLAKALGHVGAEDESALQPLCQAAEEELKFFEPGVYEMEQYGSYYVLRTKGE